MEREEWIKSGGMDDWMNNNDHGGGAGGKGKGKEDFLEGLKIETDLKRSVQADIAHHRSIGTYRGKR